MNKIDKEKQTEVYVQDIAEIVADIADALYDRDYEENVKELEYLTNDLFIIEKLTVLLRYSNRLKSLVISK